MDIRRKHLVTAVPAAASDAAQAHFEARLAFETDPADVHADLEAHGDDRAFVLVDTRSPADFEDEHIPGAINIPHARIGPRSLELVPDGAIVVTYCWSIACNASTRGAARFAALGVPVKEMIGGLAAWKAEGWATVRA